MQVRQLCSRELVSAPENASVGEVARLMRDRHVGAIVITGSRNARSVALGIITDRDIVRAQLERAGDLSELPAFQIMTPDPLLLPEHTTLGDAIDRLALRGVRRAPVVNAGGELVGLISVDDLIGQVARELSSLARLLGLQPTIEGLSANPQAL